MSTENPLRYTSDDTNPYAPPQAALDVEPVDLIPTGDRAAAAAVRRAHIGHEASIKSIGLLHYVGAFFGFLGAGGCMIAALVLRPQVGQWEMAFLFGAGVFYMAFSGLQVALAIGLTRLQPWARWTEVVLIALPLTFYGILAIVLIVTREDPSALIGILFGSAILGYILYLLVAPKATTIFSAEYKTIIAQTPHIKYRTSLLVKIALALLVVVIVLAVLGAIVSAIVRSSR